MRIVEKGLAGGEQLLLVTRSEFVIRVGVGKFGLIVLILVDDTGGSKHLVDAELCLISP